MLSGETIFNGYHLLKLLGEGGTSKVYLARNIKVGQLVAVKIVDKRKGGTPWLVEREMLIELRHPSIPVIIDIEEDDDYFYLIEEYVEGTLLSNYRGKLQEAEALEMMLQLCDVLSYLHTSLPTPIVYKDLKPNNIIVMKNGHLKLIDFGIAKKHDANSEPEKIHYATKAFAAPEQYGLGDIDTRTDIYSLGVMMYFLLTGISLIENFSAPYDGRNLSSALDAVLKKMASPLSDRRYNSIEEVAKEVGALMDGRKKTELIDRLIEEVPDVIIVLGIGRRVGTTHTSIQLAAGVRSLGLKSVIVEGHQEGVLANLVCCEHMEQVGRQSLSVGGISIYPYQKNIPVQLLLDEKPDVLVIDGGDMQYWHAAHNKKATVLAITTVQDWEVSRVEEYLMDYPPYTYTYGLNMVTEARLAYFTEALEDMDFMMIPYTNEPFKPDERVVRWIEGRLAQDKEMKTDGHRHRGFKIKKLMASFVASK